MEQEQKKSESNIERLANELADTNRYLRHTFSFRMIMIRGLITGIATVIGASVIASILFSLLRLVFGDIPYLDI